MWCKSCQQDVPGVAAAGDASRICCPRCNHTLSSGAVVASYSSEDAGSDGDAKAEGLQSSLAGKMSEPTGLTSAAGTDPPPLNFDDWQLDDDVRLVNKMLRSPVGKSHLRFDAAHNQRPEKNPPAPHFSARDSTSKTDGTTASRPSSSSGGAVRIRPAGVSSLFSWVLMSMGLMTFVCGAVLLGWYFHDGQEQLWRLGLPLTLGGQVALLFGLIVQLEALWKNTRGTSVTLEELDQQIDELRQTAAVMNQSNSGAAKSFYVHMAEDASPEVLLADLKGQLDVLAVKMAQRR